MKIGFNPQITQIAPIKSILPLQEYRETLSLDVIPRPPMAEAFICENLRNLRIKGLHEVVRPLLPI
jgi:hypothetical protein